MHPTRMFRAEHLLGTGLTTCEAGQQLGGIVGKFTTDRRRRPMTKDPDPESGA